MELAARRAFPTAMGQGFRDIVCNHQPEGTVATSRNEGAERAQGRFLCFLDADDELAPGYVAAMNEAMSWYDEARAEKYLWTPAVEYVRGRRRQEPKIWDEVDLKDGNWLVIGTLIARDLFLRIGGFKEWPMYEDWCLWQRADRAFAEVQRVPDAVYVAHVSANTRNRGASRRTMLSVHEAIRRENWPELYDDKAPPPDGGRPHRQRPPRI